MLVKFICSAHLSFLYAFFFFFLINPVCSKPILSKLKNLRCAKLSVSYGRINLAGLCLVVTLQTSNPVNHLTQNETYFTTLASEWVRAEIKNIVVPISSSLCVLKRCLYSCFFFFFKSWPTYFHKKRNKIQAFYYYFIIFLECDTPKQQNSFI